MTRAAWLPSPTRLRRRWLVALFVVFLYHAPQIASFQLIRNRYFRPWEAADPLAFALSILLISLAAVVVSLAADVPRLRGLRRWLAVAFVGLLVGGILTNVPGLRHRHQIVYDGIGFGFGALSGYVFSRPNSKLVRLTYAVCLFLWTLVPIVLVESMTWNTWSNPREAVRVVRPADPRAHPVYFFVFDEWSWLQSTKDGAFRRSLPHIRALSDSAILFRNAHSPSTDTYRSLPMLIYHTREGEQLPRVFVSRGRGHEWVNPGEDARPEAARTPSLFRLARAHGYNTALAGFYLPYRKVLGDQVDVCDAWSNYPEPRNLLERMEYQAVENLRFNVDPISRHLFRPLTAHLYSAYWLRMNRALHRDASAMLDSLPRNSLVFIHYPLPHAPYIYDTHGGFTGDYKVRWGVAHTDDEDRMLGTAAEYARHLVYLDQVLGGFMDELRRDGTYDDALVIVTSDHHWRTEPDSALRRRSFRWVPLIVKLPGQHAGGVVDDSFPNVESWHFAEQAIAGHTTDERVARLIARYGGGAAAAAPARGAPARR